MEKNNRLKTIPPFTKSALFTGMAQSIPIALAVATYGVVFGVLAGQVGLELSEAVFMSATVFAGSSQLVALEIWAHPPPATTLVLTTLVVNLRYILMGAALARWFSGLRPSYAYGSLFLMNDESWALTMGWFARGNRDAAFFLGSGLAVFIAWLSSTAIGRTVGGALAQPERYGFDFAFTAVFVSLLCGMWRGKSDVFPWAVAACTAVIFSRLLPGSWYILAGAVAGSITGAFTHGN